LRITKIACCLAIAILFFTSPAAEASPHCNSFTLISGSCVGAPITTPACDPGFFNYIVKCSELNILSLVGYTRVPTTQLQTTDPNNGTTVNTYTGGGVILINPGTTTPFLASIISGFQPIVYMLLTLYLVLFGYRFVTGGIPERDLRKEAMLAVVKFSLVAYFALYMGFANYYGFFFNMSQTLVNIFTSYSTSTSAGSTVMSPSVIGCNDPTQYVDIWQRTDCTLYTLLGYTAGATAIAMIPLILGFLFIGPIGWMIAVMLIAAPVLMMASYVTAALAFIMAEIAVTFMLSFAPIFIPMVLFGKTTEKMFKKWFELLISYSIQPVVILGYLALMISVLNVVLLGSADNTVPGAANIIGAAAGAVGSSTVGSLDGSNTPPLAGAAEPTTTIIKPAPPANLNPSTPGNVVATFVINLIGDLLTIFLLFAFMINVVQFSSQLVGLGQSGGFAGKVNMVGATIMVAQSAVKIGVSVAKSAATGFSDGGAQIAKTAAEEGGKLAQETVRR